jgi:hypothetical protein
MLAIAGKAYGRAIGTDMVETWSEFFGDFTPEEGAHAIREHITESPHFPAISDIRKRAASARVSQVDVSAAWTEVRKAFGSVGRYGYPKWSSPAIAAAVETIGWIELCNTQEVDMPTVRAQFERYLKARAETALRGANVGSLVAHKKQLHAGEFVAEIVKNLTSGSG